MRGDRARCSAPGSRRPRWSTSTPARSRRPSGAAPFDVAGRRVRGDRGGRRLGGGDGGVAAALREALGENALALHAPAAPAEVAALWRWRDGVAIAVTAQRGGKMSEDVVVPLDRLGDAIEAALEIGARHGLEACSWGHAGDGNLHATFLLDAGDAAQIARAEEAAAELFATAAAMGGSISGEHGLGARQVRPPRAAVERGRRAAAAPRGSSGRSIRRTS